MSTETPKTPRRDFLATALAGASTVALAAGTPALAKRNQEPLFEDNFFRKNGKGWGRAWFNQRYGRGWAIREGRGIYRVPATENAVSYRPNPVLVLDHDVRNVDLRATVSVSNTAGHVGVIARAISYANYYAVHMGGGHLEIVRCGVLRESRLAQTVFSSEANRRYRMRFQVKGAGPVILRAKVWPVGAPEPLRWSIEFSDAEDPAFLGSGSFGLYVRHASDGRGLTLRVDEFIARSSERPLITPPAIAYSLVGLPFSDAKRIRAAAKTSVPAQIGFQYGTDPTFTTNTFTIDPVETRNKALTVKADLDLSILENPGVVHWRAFARRKGAEVFGPSSSFRLPQDALPVRFAFGACTKWGSRPHRSFEQARLKLVDFYIHQGDFGYPPHRVIAQAPDTYQDLWTRMLMDEHVAALCREAPFGFYRDDSDYGRNQSYSRNLRKFTIEAHGELNANPSNDYFEFRYGDMAFFCLDCRRYSTGKIKDPAQRSKLGNEQKKWLMRSMEDAIAEGASLLVVASPQAFGSDATPGAWRRAFQSEWRELIDYFEGLGAPILIVSGDAHAQRLYEFPQKSLPTSTPRIVEFLSAGTEHKRFHDDVDPEFLLPDADAKEEGFGVVDVGPEQQVGDQRIRILTLSAIRTADGSAMWSKNYAIVSGVGIIPIGL